MVVDRVMVGVEVTMVQREVEGVREGLDTREELFTGETS